jgi:Ca-activated chloride channel family protein
MKRITLVLSVSLLCVAACGCLHAESRVNVYTGVDRPVVLAGCDENIIIKVGLTGIDTGRRVERVPINVAIVLDKSGSMGSGRKMEDAKRGAVEIIERLSRDDVVSLVVYDTRPRVVIPAQRVRYKQELIATIKNIFPGGNTALYGGVTFGASEVRKYMSWEYINRIILLSDGLANVGPQTTGELACLGRSLGREGITVSTIGVGLDYNEDLMTALAARSGGNSYFASTSRELPKIFAEEIGEAMTVVARDVRIYIDCGDGVKPVTVIGREGDISERQMSVTVGELYGRNDKYALFEVRVPRDEPGRNLEAAEVTVEYVDPHTNETMRDRQQVTIAYAADEEIVEENRDKQVVKDAVLTRTSEIKMQAVDLSDKGDYKAAAALMEQNALELEKVARECDNDEEIVGEAVTCGTMSRSISANLGLTKGGRKKAMNEAYTQTTQQGYVSDDKDADEDKD